MTSEQWEVFRRTGTSHLIAISGLHIGLIAGFMFLVVNFVWRQIPALTLRIPAQQIAAVFSLGAALFYSLLAGFSLPTQRALIMLTVVLSGVLLRRRVATWDSLSLALLTVLVMDPLSVMSASFWLSFGAVTVIICTINARLKPSKLWWRWGRVDGYAGGARHFSSSACWFIFGVCCGCIPILTANPGISSTPSSCSAFRVDC